MKEYIRPRMEVEQFDVEDIITSSINPETVMNGNDEFGFPTNTNANEPSLLDN